MTCLIIGDGYGFLSCLIKEIYPESRIVLIDLGETLIFQARHCQRAFPRATHCLADSSTGSQIGDAEFIYCPAEKTDEIKKTVHIHWAINIASMQEMNSETVAGYFSFLRDVVVQENLFYCCNREEKIMPGGEVSRFYEYPWLPHDKHLIDGECSWQKFFLSYGRTKNGPTIFGARLPLIKYFDGRHVHRLSCLAVK